MKASKCRRQSRWFHFIWKPSEQNAVPEAKEQAQQAVQQEAAEPQQQQQLAPIKNYPSIKIDIVLSADEIQAEMERAKVLYTMLLGGKNYFVKLQQNP